MNETKIIINNLLVNLFNRILSIEEDSLQKEGVKLTMNEVHILEAIRNSKIPNISNVSKKLRITKGTLSTSIKNLINKNYIFITLDENDKRIKYLNLNDNSLKILKIHDKFHDEMIDSVIKDLNIDNNKSLIDSLRNLNNYLKERF